MKTKLTQRRFKAVKKSACGLCKPWKQGWEGKRPIGDVRQAAVGKIVNASGESLRRLR